MLLSTLTANLQANYATIQAQIEVLQEQQRQIQAQLQRLGSVESKMESAAALIMEAIADIREVCPEELPGYKQVVTGLFGKAIALIQPEPEVVEPEVVAEVVEPKVVAEVVEPSENLIPLDKLNELPINALRAIAKIKGISSKNLKRYEIAQKLADAKVTHEDLAKTI